MKRADRLYEHKKKRELSEPPREPWRAPPVRVSSRLFIPLKEFEAAIIGPLNRGLEQVATRLGDAADAINFYGTVSGRMSSSKPNVQLASAGVVRVPSAWSHWVRRSMLKMPKDYEIRGFIDGGGPATFTMPIDDLPAWLSAFKAACVWYSEPDAHRPNPPTQASVAIPFAAAYALEELARANLIEPFVFRALLFDWPLEALESVQVLGGQSAVFRVVKTWAAIKYPDTATLERARWVYSLVHGEDLLVSRRMR